MSGPREDKPARLKQLAWFIGLWLAGVAAVGLLALIIRTIINAQFP
ncbi:MAG: DUF2474 family protein [Hyphomicrobiaceae bacterium]